MERPFTFVHTADLHLGRPFAGLDRPAPPAVADALRRAPFETLDAIVDLALERRVDALLVAGDVFDAADRPLAAQLRFRDALDRACRGGVSCFVLHGNHDPVSGWEPELTLPRDVHRFGSTVEAVPVRRPGRERPIAHVMGRSWSRRLETDNPVPAYARCAAGLDSPPVVALLHAEVGSEGGTYASTTPTALERIGREAGIDYWALGHRHDHRSWGEPPIAAYPGTPQGRSRRETGPRGVLVGTVTASEDGARRHRRSPVELEWVTLARVVRRRLEVTIDDLPGIGPLLDRLAAAFETLVADADGRSLLVDVEIGGRGPLHRTLARTGSDPDSLHDLLEPLIEGLRVDLEAPFPWIASVANTTAPAFDRDRLARQGGLPAELVAASDELSGELSTRGPDAVLDLLLARPEAAKIAPLLAELSTEALATLLADADSLALERLDLDPARFAPTPGRGESP